MIISLFKQALIKIDKEIYNSFI